MCIIIIISTAPDENRHNLLQTVKQRLLPGALFSATLWIDEHKQRYYIWRGCYLPTQNNEQAEITKLTLSLTKKQWKNGPQATTSTQSVAVMLTETSHH